MAIVRIAGKRRWITESNSKPDIPGIFRSERSSSGTSFYISRNAEIPSSAVRTLYPISLSTWDSNSRMEVLSSTISNAVGEFGIIDLP